MEYSFNLNKIKDEISSSDGYWKTFFTKEDFRLGVIYLRPEQEDTQSPHETDEVYFIVEGDGYLNIDGTDFQVKPEVALYVPKNTPHHFHSNSVPILCYYAFN